MVVMKKQVKKEPNKDVKEVDEKEIEKAIANAEKKEKKKEWVRILLRIKGDFIEYIDEKIKDELNATRTSWILETIQERIKRENKRKENV